MYCAQKLPDFLKSVEAYQKGDFEQALKDAFIGFDSTLVNPLVVEELKKFASDVMDGSETEEDPDEEENLQELWEERDMDIKDVLEKYKEGKTNPAIERATGGAKPSPFLRGRRNCSGEGNSAGTSGPSSSNCIRKKLDENEDAVSSTSKQKSEEIVEAASSSGSNSLKNDVASDPSSTNETTKLVDTNCSPVSSSTSKNSVDVQINGDASTAKTSVSSQENEISTNSSKVEKVSSSSQLGSQSNGEISSNSNDKPASNSISSTKDFDSAESSTDDDEYNEGEFTVVYAELNG